MQQFRLLANDPTKEICLVHGINDFCLSVEYKSQTTFESDILKAKEVIACFNTCWARIKLYDVTDFLMERFLYMDSVVFTAHLDLNHMYTSRMMTKR